MKHFYTSPHAIDITTDTPLIFLAGPVQGVPDWQTPYAQQILENDSALAIASPRRTHKDQLRFNADEQVAWEHRALERAHSFGVLAFWLAAQDISDGSYPKNRAYAQTTRIELGKAIGWKQFQPDLPVVIGIDPSYTVNGGGSEGYIRREATLNDILVHDQADLFLQSIIDETQRLQQ